MSDIQKDAAERFARDTANHVMTVLHDDGLYRHLRFAQPGWSSGWFELITWPGTLAIRGDNGGLLFSRIDDMLQFFRRNGSQHGINPGYWAEKTPDHGASLLEYSEDMLRTELEPYLAEYETAYPDIKAEYDALPSSSPQRPAEPKTPAEIRELVKTYDEDGELTHEQGARALLSELEAAEVVMESWEWDLSDWDYHYLWCCHAIVWGIAQYDAAKPAPAETAAPVVTVEIPAVTR